MEILSTNVQGCKLLMLENVGRAAMAAGPEHSWPNACLLVSSSRGLQTPQTFPFQRSGLFFCSRPPNQPSERWWLKSKFQRG